MAYQDVILADTPIEYWRFNETSGTTAASSGSGAHAAVHSNGVLVNQPGKHGRGVTYDGVDDTTTVDNVADFMNSTTFTVEMWVKFGAPVMDYPTFFRRDGNGKVFIIRTRNPNQTRGNIIETYFNGRTVDTGTTTFNDNLWHHVVATRNGTSLRLFVDNVEYTNGSGTITAGGSGSAAPTYIGRGSGTTEYLKGSVDEVAVYTTALSTTRIAAHYNEPSNANITQQAPAMTVNVTAPVVKSRLGRTITVTPMAASVSMPDPKASALQHRYITQDRGRFNGTADSASEMIYLRPNEVLMQFALPDIGEGYVLDQAILRIKPGGQPNTYVSFVTEAWDETTSNAPAVEAGSEILTQNLFTSSAANITAFVKRWMGGTPNNGIALSNASDSSPVVYARNTTAPQNAPYVEYTLKVAVPEPVAVSAPAMTVNVTMPQHRSGVGSTGVVTGAGSASVVMSAPAIKTVKSPRTEVKAMTVTVQFPGGEARNPDYSAPVEPMELWLSSQPVNQFVGYPRTVTVDGAMNASVAVNDATVNLRTDRRLFVTNSMGVIAKMVGIYSKESDRYFTYVPSTVDADDVWLPLDEISGTVAHDIVGTSEVGQQPDINHGEYVGNPELNLTGPYLRKAVKFDGIDDHLKINYKPQVSYFAPTADTTIEFSLKTTQLNGVLMTGNNIGVYGETSSRMVDQMEIRLVNGELALYTGAVGGRLTYPIRKLVADGEWHHVVLSIPASRPTPYTDKPYFLAVDGKVVWQRFSAGLSGRMAPSAFMARVEVVDYATVVSQVVAGELSNVIIRTNSAISPVTAQKLYYEWSETLLIKPEPMTVSVSMKDPIKARGNAKRMIALYGLPHGPYREVGDGVTQDMDEARTYYSVFAGYHIDNASSDVSPYTTFPSLNSGRPPYYSVKPFALEGYMVYPVAIFSNGAPYNGGRYPLSAPGMERPELRDPYTGAILDEETGLSRFFNPDTDLAEPVTNFDALTVVNYPTDNPESGLTAPSSADPLREPRQTTYDLTRSQWLDARDKLRDSILSAAYRGVNLWVNEPHMAQHLGIIQGWDKHHPGWDDSLNPYATGRGVTENFSQSTYYSNTRGQELDLLHAGPDAITNNGSYQRHFGLPSGDGFGRYVWMNQLGSYRRIVATEPGLTNLPSYERGDRIDYIKADKYDAHAFFTAYDVQDKMNGLRIGDRIGMEMNVEGPSTPTWWSAGDPRNFVVSARPQGIVGKVIAREADTYYGPYGVQRVNPYKDNATTIVVERGSVVRGQAIRGRIFVEFMSPDIEQLKIPVDKNKNRWAGEADKRVTTWDFDSRRYRQVLIINEKVTSLTKTRPNGDKYRVEYTIVTRYSEVQDPDLDFKPFLSMNSRGLIWLAQASELAPGEARAYIPAMEADVSAPAPKTTQDRGSVNVVTGAMRIDADLRQPRNFRANDVREKVTPMLINVNAPGLGKAIKVGPMEVTLTAGASTRAIGDGDRIYVYMDAQTDVTLFMKED